MSYSDEPIIILRPSQWINLKWFIFGVGGAVVLSPLGPVAILPVLVYLWKVLEVYCWTYEFGEETIIERKGILDVTTTEIHYYRIKSVQVEEPFLYRLVDIGNLHVITSDQFSERVTFVAVPMVLELRTAIREMVYIHRGDKGVKEFDLYEL